MKKRAFALALLMAVATGLVSLSQEILWVKVISMADENRPSAFAHVLGCFLLGIALGALMGRRLQARWNLSAVDYVALALAVSGVSFFLMIGVGARIMGHWPGWGLLWMLMSVVWVSGVMGGVFPVVAHLAAPAGERVGPRVGWVYLANILGSTAGPLLTGFVLLDIETLQNAVLLVAAGPLVLAQVLALNGPRWEHRPSRGRRGATVIGMGGLTLAAMLVTQGPLYDQFLPFLHFGTDHGDTNYEYVAQTRSGIVGVWPSDDVFGDGLYDGTFNLDPIGTRNGVRRAYFAAVSHPAPRRVLVVGLGSASWSRTLANDPAIETIDIVEINPGYVDLIWHYPDIASVLEEDKVTLHFDDARRWLRQRPDVRYDLVVMNGSWHWRGHATHVLSSEFLIEIRDHLEPGGVLFMNTTSSDDVAYTASGVFQHVVRFGNCIAVSADPFETSVEERRRRLQGFAVAAGDPFAADGGEAAMDDILTDLTDVGPSLRASQGLWFITENNMATEFKTNGSGAWWRSLPTRLYDPGSAWWEVLW